MFHSVHDTGSHLLDIIALIIVTLFYLAFDGNAKIPTLNEKAIVNNW